MLQRNILRLVSFVQNALVEHTFPHFHRFRKQLPASLKLFPEIAFVIYTTYAGKSKVTDKISKCFRKTFPRKVQINTIMELNYRIRCVNRPQPDDTRLVTAAERTDTVECEGERIHITDGRLNSTTDVWYTCRIGLANEFQGKMKQIGLNPIDQICLESALTELADFSGKTLLRMESDCDKKPF